MLRFVVRDGDGFSAEILDIETGQDLTKSLAVAYNGKITLGQRVTAELSLCMVECDVAGRATWKTKHPITGEFAPVSAFEFSDGVRVEFSEDGSPRVVEPKAVAQMFGSD